MLLDIAYSFVKMGKQAKYLTKAEILEQTRAEHLATAAGTPDDELRTWSMRTYVQLREAEMILREKRSIAQELEACRKEARTKHRTSGSVASAKEWRDAIVKADVAQSELRVARDCKNKLEALSDLLASLLAKRSGNGGNTGDEACGTANNSNSESGKKKRRRGQAPPEECPFCNHSYTVRDGTLSQMDAEGRRLQLRKCQCRAMAPPCRNCPSCRTVEYIMAAAGEEQLRLCREELRCEICACECPGAGKWIEGDSDSRMRYRDRAMQRYEQLSALICGSWSGKMPVGLGDNSTYTEDNDDAAYEVSGSNKKKYFSGKSLRRLPADIKDQLEVVAAAQSLQRSILDDETFMPSAAGSHDIPENDEVDHVSAQQVSAHGPYCNNNGNQEKLENDDELQWRRRRRTNVLHQNIYEVSSDPSKNDGIISEHANPSCHRSEESHHHRCAHPHEECNSDCCSVAGP